jgi:hypothetical protein
MVDTGTGLAVLGPSAVILKILGPTADYVGDNFQQWTENRVQNIRRVFAKAEKKLGPSQLEEPGQVPPRVLKGILEEGQFCDDEVGAEYLGGVLASARSGTERDDRAAALLATISRLSTYQLRTHYIAYACAQRVLAGRALELGNRSTREDHALFLPVSTWEDAMEFSPVEARDSPAIVDHTLVGLAREDLIDDSLLATGERSPEKALGKRVPEAGFLYALTLQGIELFTAAHGLSGRPNALYQQDPSTFVIETPLSLDGGALLASDLPEVGADA